MLHVYNKHRHPIVGADGTLKPAKLKYKATAHNLHLGYGLIVDPLFLKNKVVRPADWVPGDRRSRHWCITIFFFLPHMHAVSPSMCARVCACVRGQKTLEEMCNSAQFQEDEAGYDSETHKNLLMSRYPRAGPGMGQWAGKGGASASGRAGAAAAAPGSSLSPDAAHLGRQLQLIHGALVDMCSEMRIISGRALSASRGTVAKAASHLLNTKAEDNETGQSRG